MRLESALYSSKSGLDAHGQAIAVVGDNIANVSTTGYKASRINFADLFAEGTDGRESTAGPSSGNGVRVQSVQQLHETGTIESTGRQLDAAIAGDGFFLVGDAASPSYTRAGDFSINGDGFLVTGDGKQVLGYTGTNTSLSGLNLQNVQQTGTPTTKASVFGNLASDAAITTVPANPQTFLDVGKGASFISNMTVYDSLGKDHNVTIGFYKTGANTWTAQAYMDGGEAGGTAGVPIQVGGNATLSFDGSGALTEASKAGAVITATPAYSGGASAGNFAIDLSSFSQFAGSSQLSAITQDGKGIGEVKGYDIRENGELQAIMSNGDRYTVGTLALGTFVNENGLDRAGNNAYVPTAGAGTAKFGKPGEGSFGKLEGSSLERSTVDMSNEFINLVLYQRGYQASSQTLSTASGMIKDTLALIR